jgi:DNA invertase Pin-like site-specific DNA recombinase
MRKIILGVDPGAHGAVAAFERDPARQCARVSTTDQTIDHQAVQARAAGFQIEEVVADDGVSGIRTTLAERPQGKRLFDMLRSGDTLVVRWVDRLGRNYADVTDTIRAFMAKGVIVRTVINGLVFDGATKDPMQKAVRDALIAFMAATAEAQAEATREAQRAGIAHAKANGPRSYRGRKPSFGRTQLGIIRDLLARDTSPTAIAEAAGVSRQVIYRVQDDPAKAEAMLVEWGL